MKKINVFLPCRKGSERVPKKNIKPFAHYKNGLIELKLSQLLNSEYINNIFLTTNDDEIINYAKSLSSDKIIIHKRSDDLSSSSTSTDELINHALDLIGDGEILWTHVTSPFINSLTYDDIIQVYFNEKKKGFDSLMTVNHLHGFIWDKDGPINYERSKEKWPRTQTILPLFELNSGVFIANSDIYKNLGDRIGKKPYTYILGKIKGFDIDWNDDFKIAEAIIKSKIIKHEI